MPITVRYGSGGDLLQLAANVGQEKTRQRNAAIQMQALQQARAHQARQQATALQQAASMRRQEIGRASTLASRRRGTPFSKSIGERIAVKPVEQFAGQTQAKGAFFDAYGAGRDLSPEGQQFFDTLRDDKNYNLEDAYKAASAYGKSRPDPASEAPGLSPAQKATQARYEQTAVAVEDRSLRSHNLRFVRDKIRKLEGTLEATIRDEDPTTEQELIDQYRVELNSPWWPGKPSDAEVRIAYQSQLREFHARKLREAHLGADLRQAKQDQSDLLIGIREQQQAQKAVNQIIDLRADDRAAYDQLPSGTDYRVNGQIYTKP